MGRVEGGKKAAEKNKANDPQFYAKIGRAGGSVKVPKGFARMPKEKVSEAGRRGGIASRNTRVI